MDFHQLRVFQAAARALSFTAAGRELSLSQSTVSLHIKQMEDDLGCSLFVRSRQRVSLSQAGEVLLTYADRILAETRNATVAMHEFATLKRGTIRLGTGASTLKYLLPVVLADFRVKYPQITVVITTGTTEVLLEELLANRLDFAIVMSPSDALAGVEAVPLLLEELAVVLPADHPLAARGTLQPAELEDHTWISHLRGTAMFVVQQRFFEQCKVEPRFSMEMENMEAIKDLVLQSVGFALLPACSVAGRHGNGLAARRVRGLRLTRQLLLAAADWQAQPPATRRLAGRILKALHATEKGSGAAPHGPRAEALIESANELDEHYVISARSGRS